MLFRSPTDTKPGDRSPPATPITDFIDAVTAFVEAFGEDEAHNVFSLVLLAMSKKDNDNV